jgi:hypothetical protein
VCLVSMATSSGEKLPRDIEFLFSVNRLNVAVSRAQALFSLARGSSTWHAAPSSRCAWSTPLLQSMNIRPRNAKKRPT